MVDNFDGWVLGSIHEQGEWFINDFGSLGSEAFEVATDATDETNQVFVAVETEGNDATVEDGFLRLENPIEDGATGTLFFRFRATDPGSHVNFGLSDVEEPTGTWNHFEAQFRDNQDGGLDFRAGGAFSNVLVDGPLDEWISVWMVIDNDDDFSRNFIQSESDLPEQQPRYPRLTETSFYSDSEPMSR